MFTITGSLLRFASSETDGAVIASTLLVLVLSVESSRRPRDLQVSDHDRPVGLTSQFSIVEVTYYCLLTIKVLALIYQCFTQQEPKASDRTNWCQTYLILFYRKSVPKITESTPQVRDFLEKIQRIENSSCREFKEVKLSAKVRTNLEKTGNFRENSGDFWVKTNTK